MQYLHDTGKKAGWTCKDVIHDSTIHITVYAGIAPVFTVSITDGHERAVYNRVYHEYKNFGTFAALKDHIEDRLSSLKHHYAWQSLERLVDVVDRYVSGS